MLRLGRLGEVRVPRRLRPGRALLLLTVAIATLTGGPPAPVDAVAQEPVVERPNILVIVTDDQRSGTLDVMPATQRLFKQRGTRYANAFATSPLCCPSRASIMTGQYPHNHGVRKNDQSDQLIQETTLQYYLQQNGYLTGIAGKYLNGWKETEASPPYFDRWATVDDSNYRKVYFDFLANVNGVVRSPRDYSTDFIAKMSVRFMRQFEAEDETPWFMYVAPFASHKPFEPERRYRDVATPQWFGNPSVTEGDRSDKPPWVQDRNVRLPGGRAVARLQSRTLMSADDLVRSVFNSMTRLEETRDTLAIFISDNGYLWGEHGLASKRFPYTGAIKVPLMVRWPGVIPEKAIDERLAANIDVAPTILQTVGISPAHAVDGRSLFADQPREKLLFEYFGSRLGGDVPAWASLRSLAYQYVEYYEDGGATPLFTEYYDLVNDPFQLENLLQDGDPTNDPQATLLSVELARIRDCEGESCP